MKLLQVPSLDDSSCDLCIESDLCDNCTEFCRQAFLSKAAYLSALFLTEELIFLSFYLNGLLASGDLWLTSSIFSNEIEQNEANGCVHGQGF